VTTRRTPHLVGIAGASGSGKTTLAHALATSLADAAVLSMDAYYRDLAHLERSACERWNFDAPEAFDWERFVADLRGLQRGETIQRPIYDFTTHTRRTAVEPVEPRPFLIVEGLLVLHHPGVRTLLDTTVFLEVEARTAIDRRITRDRLDRGRNPDAVRVQYARDVHPMYERHVRPTARWATLTLSGADPTETSVQRLLEQLGRMTNQRLPPHLVGP
jgi:uridine kinase